MRLEGKTADQFIVDVRDGVDDDTLMDRYGVTAKELLLLKGSAREILEKRKHELSKPRMVNAREFLHEIKAGTDDLTLQRKFDLTSRQLQQLLRELISAGAATPLQLSHLLKITESQVEEALSEFERVSQSTQDD